jgi:electron transport complex protein RnfC
MRFSLNGIHVPHRKNTDGKPAVKMAVPKTVTIPTSMHIGSPATPVVKAGDSVKVGTLIAEASGRISSPVHSSVSGTVKKIDRVLLANGVWSPAIVIESDGLMEVDESVKAPEITTREEFIAAVKASGIVGLGGAGFPTYFKLDVDPERIEEIIINGAECEPYITSDSLTMVERYEDIKAGVLALMKFLSVKKFIIGIEENKKAAIASMQALSAEIPEFEVKVLPSIYPQGGEKVLVYHATGKVIKVGKLPIDVGCIVTNCTTLAAVGKYLQDGMPLVSKCVTVDGGAVTEPANVIAPIGASLEDVFEAVGGLKCEPAKLISGGPMMGITVTDISSPVTKPSNAVLALTAKEAWLPKTTNCIRCGTCTNTCPFGIAPADIERALRKKDAERIEALNVNACMECGCCSFVCPANRPLAQSNKLAKAFLKEAKEANK